MDSSGKMLLFRCNYVQAIMTLTHIGTQQFYKMCSIKYTSLSYLSCSIQNALLIMVK